MHKFALDRKKENKYKNELKKTTTKTETIDLFLFQCYKIQV
jgi:hypothetical protein